MVSFMLTRGRTTAPLVKENKLTVWVRLADGNVIKRHRVKHNVKARRALPPRHFPFKEF